MRMWTASSSASGLRGSSGKTGGNATTTCFLAAKRAGTDEARRAWNMTFCDRSRCSVPEDRRRLILRGCTSPLSPSLMDRGGGTLVRCGRPASVLPPVLALRRRYDRVSAASSSDNSSSSEDAFAAASSSSSEKSSVCCWCSSSSLRSSFCCVTKCPARTTRFVRRAMLGTRARELFLKALLDSVADSGAGSNSTSSRVPPSVLREGLGFGGCAAAAVTAFSNSALASLRMSSWSTHFFNERWPHRASRAAAASPGEICPSLTK
mmetsp:Transcript_11944/g.35888  ORF Transcript_11944/g.35888 Transcript_11944/m.35888 type:complete len:264 (+) Transcript_11944:2832-3623(+)